ncbi:response regulator [Stenotrophomonas beteli]|uniref:LuxR family transcriptional regulator n=1 Tax=Stenotrophomonas beteli TaxID=3384461 RepID=A0A0R0B688_9GAMM|nr:response regulator [Stenotrophomonas maltophilia]KRG48435.1 LuxR family transcriptional regulator [Stenotrophomonas maltophilia]
MRLRVILADDHPIVRIGARALIEGSGVGEVIAEANNPGELLQALEDHSCDVLVTDFSMPGSQQPDGFAMLELIRRRHPNLPILLLSMANNLGILRMVVSTRVLGLIDKASSLDELPQALQVVHRGAPYVSKGLKKRIAELGSETVAAGGKQPSPREGEVLRLLASGLSVTEIAMHLNRSKTTISRQKTDAMRKLGISNDAELFEFLRDEGISN